MTTSPTPSAADVVGDAIVRIEDVVDRDALTEMCRSIQALFGIGVRVYSSEGALLTNVASELDVCGLVNELSPGRVACGSTVTAAKSVDPGDAGDVVIGCLRRMLRRAPVPCPDVRGSPPPSRGTPRDRARASD